LTISNWRAQACREPYGLKPVEIPSLPINKINNESILNNYKLPSIKSGSIEIQDLPKKD
jgi:hypothetical protein